MYLTTIGAVLFLATAALLLGDYYWNLFGGAVPGRALAKATEKLGSAAMVLGAAVIGVYPLRLLAPSFPALLQPGIRLLRAWHPLLGALAVSLAAFHSYVLAFARSTEQLAVYTGVPLVGAALLLAGTGWSLRLMRQNLSLRKIHTYLAFVALALLLFHTALAD